MREPGRYDKGDHVPYRYVVLYEEPSNRLARPVGVAIERDGCVRVETPEDLCLPKRYSEPFVVAGPDMTTIAYMPDDPRYFDQVLIDLSRALGIGEAGVLTDGSESAFRRLLLEKVLRPRRYAEAHQYRTIQTYHSEMGYVHETAPAVTAREAKREIASSREPVLVA